MLKCCGRIVRMGDIRWHKLILTWSVEGGRGGIGRPELTWKRGSGKGDEAKEAVNWQVWRKATQNQ
jgi:hypothetical protein